MALIKKCEYFALEIWYSNIIMYTNAYVADNRSNWWFVNYISLSSWHSARLNFPVFSVSVAIRMSARQENWDMVL